MQALDNIITLAEKRQAEMIIFSGDIFDSDVRSLHSRIHFREALRRAGRSGIECYIAHGNHDPIGTDMVISFDLENVTTFGPDPENHPLYRQETKLANVIGVSHPHEKVSDNLALSIEGPAEGFNIGVLHCNVGSISEDNYAPCNLSDLLNRRIHYWALGHVHQAQILHRDPYVVYPGITQGRHINENGPKGVYVVHVKNNHIVELEFVPVDTVRWEKMEIDITDMTYLEDIIDLDLQLSPNIFTLLRLRCIGRGPLNHVLRDPHKVSELLPLLNTEMQEVISLQVNTQPEMDLQERRRGEDLLATLLKSFDELKTLPSQELLTLILKEGASKRIRNWLENFNDEELAQIVEDAELWTAGRLMEDET